MGIYKSGARLWKNLNPEKEQEVHFNITLAAIVFSVLMISSEFQNLRKLAPAHNALVLLQASSQTYFFTYYHRTTVFCVFLIHPLLRFQAFFPQYKL